MPSMSMLRSMRSRVVPGCSVTMATSAPASALSRLDLPTLGAPTSATCRPSRSSAPCCARAAHLRQRRRGVLKAGGRVGRAQEVDLLLRKVQRRLGQGAQLRELVGQRPRQPGEFPLQRAHRAARGRGRAGIDEVGHGLGLGQVELVVEKGAAREFPGLCNAHADAAPRLEAARQQQLQDDRTAVPLQFEDVLAGIGVRTGEEQCQSDIDRRPRGIQEGGVQRMPRLQPARGIRAEQRRQQGGQAAARHAHDADAAAPRSRGDGDDGIPV